MTDPIRFKLWDWVNAGPSPGWWRIRANLSLKSCSLAKARLNESGCYSFVILQGMTLAPTLYHALHLIIAEQIPGLPIQEGKFKSDNCISIQMLTTKNEEFQIMTVKSALSNDGAIYTLDNTKLFSLVTFTKRLRNCRSKRNNEYKDDNKLFGCVTLTKRLHVCGNKHISKNIKDNDSKS